MRGYNMARRLAAVFKPGAARLNMAAVGVCAAVIVATQCVGCGASAATQGAYALEQARCIANEREIVDRAGTTLEQDQADLAAERTRCDAALDAIEEAD